MPDKGVNNRAEEVGMNEVGVADGMWGPTIEIIGTTEAERTWTSLLVRAAWPLDEMRGSAGG